MYLLSKPQLATAVSVIGRSFEECVMLESGIEAYSVELVSVEAAGIDCNSTSSL